MSKPKNTTFYNNGSSLNGIWGDGNLVGAPVGSPTITNGMLDLTGDLVKYIEYEALDNADSSQRGCIRVRGKWNYSGFPLVTNYCLFSVFTTAGAVTNIMQLVHTVGGDLNLDLYDAGSNPAGVLLFSPFSPVAGDEFEFEINWDLASGLLQVFYNGNSLGVSTVTYIRGQLNKFRIGSAGDVISNSEFYIENFLIFDRPQHNSNYIPDWSTIPPAYPNNVSKCLCYGYVQNFIGGIVPPTVKIKLNKEVVQYRGGEFITSSEMTIPVRPTDGYFEVNLVENSNMEYGSYYIMTINDIVYEVNVKDEQIRNLVEISKLIVI
jgi:hypothetical protein